MSERNQLISEFGGKAASLVAQVEAGNQDMILPFTLVNIQAWEKGDRYVFNFHCPQIARGSARGDEKGLVDVIRSFTAFYNEDLNGSKDRYVYQVPEELFSKWEKQKLYDLVEQQRAAVKNSFIRGKESVIDRIINESRLPEVKAYARWEGIMDYEGVSKVIVQPLNRYPKPNEETLYQYRGSVVEHPNMEGTYLINIVKMQMERGRSVFNLITQYLTDERGNIIKTEGQEYLGRDLIQGIVNMKKRSRKAGLVSPDKSSQVELGFLSRKQDFETEKYEFQTNPRNPVLFYQEREFLPFDFDPRINPKDYQFNRFGKIPEEGIELRVLRPLAQLPRTYVDGVPSAYIFGSAELQGGMPLSFRPNNMFAFIVPGDVTVGGNSLEHKTYRWVQKANLSFLKQYVSERWSVTQYKDGEKILIK